MVSQQFESGAVIAVVGVDIGVERAGVDEEGYGVTSAARISSMRSETSSRPLRPAAAARNRRGGPPTWRSMASRVTSEMVMLRRAASWRSRRSRSSGSITVVRRIYASISTAIDCMVASVAHRYNAILLASDADLRRVAEAIGVPLDSEHS